MLREQEPPDPDVARGPPASRSTLSEQRGPPCRLSSSALSEPGAPQQQEQRQLREEEQHEDQGSLQHQHEAIYVGGPQGASLPLPRLPHPLPYDSIWRLLLLVLISIGPFLTMIFFISFLKNVGAAMIFMHWVCMVIGPAVYVHLASDGWAYYVHVYLCQGPQHSRWRRQGAWAALGFVLGAGVVYLGFGILNVILLAAWDFDLQEDVRVRALSSGLDQPFTVTLLLSLYFILVNPIIEEIFWRVFLYRELGAGVFGSAAAGLLYVKEAQPLTLKIRQAWTVLSCASSGGRHGNSDRPSERRDPERGGCGSRGGIEHPTEPATSLEEGLDVYVSAFTPPVSPSVGQTAAPTADNGGTSTIHRNGHSGTIAYYDLRVPLTGLMVLAAAYGSYHMVIFHRLMGAAFVLPSFFLVCILGGICLYVRNKERFGLLTATGLHAGVDVGVVLVLAQVLGIF